MMLGIVLGTVLGSGLLVRTDPVWSGLGLGQKIRDRISPRGFRRCLLLFLLLGLELASRPFF
ncbi:MAG: hypothetical protein ABIR56_16815 [Polaromonas sp.]